MCPKPQTPAPTAWGDPAGPPAPRTMGPLRIVTGALCAVICAAGAVGEWLIGLPAAAVLCLVIAVGSG